MGDFEGDYDDEPVEEFSSFESFFGILYSQAKTLVTDSVSDEDSEPQDKHFSSVDSRDIKLLHLYAKVQLDTKNHKAMLDLSQELNRRMRIDHVFEDLQRSSSHNLSLDKVVLPRNFPCLREFMKSYK